MPLDALRRWMIFPTVCILLASCTGGYTTRVIDTPETRSLKGHQRPYSVNGKRFDPLADSEGYTEKGLASWYGRDFHGKKTSSGEIYDMNALTAAHKTLPMGTRVRVVNEENGREVTVRVNDRGPFVKGRIIDVSYAAAKQLGLVGPGTARVRIEALVSDRPSPAKKEVRTANELPPGGFSIQVGAFIRPENARRLADKLQGRTEIVSMHRDQVGEKVFFRVTAGHFSSLAEAETARFRLEREGYANCFVVAMD